jgi:eukaryotic-like serine/threonine-protein kinase
MESNSAAEMNERLAESYSRLWESGASLPDVFAFLAAYPEVPNCDRLGVLLVDQQERWRRGQALPLRIYLSAFPDIAARGEMVRALVDGERQERRRSTRQSELATTQTANFASETPTQPMEGEAAPDDTQVSGEAPVEVKTPTGLLPVKENDLHATKSPSKVTDTHDRLSFSMNDADHLQSEAETLRAMLNTVRFTLVRRLGTGGMGVVYEAYDRQRGELVALKTMKRVDPSALVRFKHEFRSLSDITHPNLVNLYELFAVEDRWFFTMELVEGCNFLSYVKIQGLGRGLREAAEPATDDGSASDLSPTPSQGAAAEAQSFDEIRLRDALRQLAEGVSALHQSGKLHRDIKPPNVLVTVEGRVVLLDFGLTADLAGEGQTTDRQVVGTVGHMSPEQAAGQSVTPASDWYSVGVILYEAMTSQLPFAGSAEGILLAKQTVSPPSPDAFVEGLPEDLVQLCTALLDRDPKRRPSGRDVIAVLSGQIPDPIDAPEVNRTLPLIGRSRHRQVLEGLYASMRKRKTESVFVFGRTGTGKTTLVRTFLDELVDRQEAIVLSGRCYERESVPYKALDSLIDALARFLKELPAHEAQRLLPEDAAFLGRVFPVLESVEAIALARRGAPELPDQQELRRRSFAGLRELLLRLGERAPLVLAIDDLQWGDVDSAILLSDLMLSPRSPVLLFIGCFRSEDLEQSPFLHEIRKSMAKDAGLLDHRELAVEALTQAEARELALALLGRDDAVSLAQAHLVARESRGNPLFIDELVRHIQSGEPTERWEDIGQLDLDEVLWTRIQWQPEEARRLLAVVAISGRPISQALAFQASELGVSGRVALASLRSARLIRCIGRAQHDEIEVYHDRIRETVVAHLSAEVLKWNHERMARVLAASGPVDAEIMAEHYRGAGDADRACEYYSRGADQAASALAFDHAARLYRIAVQLKEGSARHSGVLWKKLGDALANAGRGAEAAQAYSKAAETATAADTLELKRLASTQLLLSGHVDDGLTLLRTLLGPLGLSMPGTPRQARLSLVWNRARLRLRGLSFTNRDESEISAMDLTRIDLCWSAVEGLSMSEPIRGADFQTRGLLLALRAGEAFRIARALAMEAGHRSTEGVSADSRVTGLLDAAQAIARRIDSPYVFGMIDMVRGFGGLMRGEWHTARTHLDLAEGIFRDRCTGVTWERDTVHNFTLWSLVQMGEMAELKRLWSVLLRESQERGDRYAASILTTFYMTMIKLAGNETIETEHELEAVVDESRNRGFSLQHSSALQSLIHIYLYRGDINRAWSRLTAAWPEYNKSMLLRIQMIMIDMLEIRSRCALAMAEKTDAPEVYLRQVKSDVRRLEGEGQRWALAHAHYLHAGIAACEEDAARAVERLILAADDYFAAGMPLRAHLLRYRLAEIHGTTEIRARREEAERWIRSQGIVSTARWAGLFAPGFARVSSESIETSF